MEKQGKQRRGRYGKILCDTIRLDYHKGGPEETVELQGRLLSGQGNLDGTNVWEFLVVPKQADVKVPGRGVGKGLGSTQYVLERKMYARGGRWLSPRGMAMEKAGLLACAFLLGAAVYKNLLYWIGF